MPPKLNITGTSRFHKTRKKPQMPLLPGDAELLRQIERQKEETRQNSTIKEPLEYLSPLKNYRPVELLHLKTLDIRVIIQSLIQNRWTDFPQNEKGHFTLKPATVAETAEFRETVPRAVTLSQLYGLFPTRTTQIDRVLSEASTGGLVKVIPINAHDGSLDLIMDSQYYHELCDTLNPALSAHARNHPGTVWFDIKDLRMADVDVPLAVSQGLLVVDPGKPGVHSLAIPNQGRLLKLVRQCRTWLLKTMLQNNRKFKELPESQIKDKLLNTRRYWTQFEGVTLEFILYDAIGSGYIDGFNTPVGRGWKVIRT